MGPTFIRKIGQVDGSNSWQSRDMQEQATTFDDYRRRIRDVMTFVEANLERAPDLNELAQVACFSPFHFHRIFRGMLGESVHEYTRRMRLERVAVRLKTSKVTVTDLAWEVGYQNAESLTRAFRSHFGMAPSQYRRCHAPRFTTKELSMKTITIEVHTVRRDERRVAFMRHVGAYDQVGSIWEELLMQVGAEGELAGDNECIGLCHSDPAVTPPDLLQYDACVTVGDEFVARGLIGTKTLAGGTFALTTHIGPYRALHETYAQLFGAWLPQSGKQARAHPCLEIYLNDPNTTDPEDLITDIYLPLEGA